MPPATAVVVPLVLVTLMLAAPLTAFTSTALLLARLLSVKVAGNCKLAVLVTVPLLYRSAALLQRVLPWIKAWVMSQQGARIDLNADDYGWQQP